MERKRGRPSRRGACASACKCRAVLGASGIGSWGSVSQWVVSCCRNGSLHAEHQITNTQGLGQILAESGLEF